MRFLTRSLAGVFLMALTLGLMAYAAGLVREARQADDGDRGRGGPEERVYAVAVETLSRGQAVPVITAYGEVASRRSLEVRAATAGRVTEVAEAFRDGGRVAAGDLLIRIDPSDAAAARDIAAADLAEAEAQAAEAATRLTLAAEDLAAAVRTRDLRAAALQRQQNLVGRGAGTSLALEEAEIALASADQSVVGRRQALAEAEARADQAGLTVERRGIALREAERTLADTTVTAPFAGVLTAATVAPGGIVSANERVGSLIDIGALEVAFRVSTAQYARLVARDALLGSTVVATLPLPEFPIEIEGRIERAGAEVGEGQTGRVLYARLDGPGLEALRPGDFMEVRVVEPPLDDVSVIAAAAATTTGEILLVGEDDRLETARVRILRRQGDALIVADAPAGRVYARERLPQLGAGVRVRPIRDVDGDGVAAAAAAPAPQRAGVVLTPERRARLIAFVEENERMPDDVKARLLAQLAADEVPSAVVERLERRMGG